MFIRLVAERETQRTEQANVDRPAVLYRLYAVKVVAGKREVLLKLISRGLLTSAAAFYIASGFGRFYFCNDFNLKGDSEMKRKHLSVKQRMQLIDKFGGKCSACGKQHLTLFTDDVDQRAAIDHIIPLSRGGSNDESNLQLLCTPCNAAKRNMTMDEFLEYRWKQAESERMLVDLLSEIPNLSDCFPKLIRNTGVVDKYNVVKALHDYVQSGR